MKLIFVGCYDISSTNVVAVYLNGNHYIDWGDGFHNANNINNREDELRYQLHIYNNNVLNPIIKIYEYENNPIEVLNIEIEDYINIYVDSEYLYEFNFRHNMHCNYKLKQISINCSKCKNFSYFLENCESLIKILKFNVHNEANLYKAFYKCINLEYVPYIENFQYKYTYSSFYKCNKLNDEFKLMLLDYPEAITK